MKETVKRWDVLRKIIIATHHNLAKGLKDTLNYISPNTVDIIAINAYVEEEDLDVSIDKALGQFDNEEQIFVFTDMVGGSVNQEFAKKLSGYNIELISGVNLPVALAIILSLSEEAMPSEMVRQIVEEAKEQVVYVNDSLLNQSMDDEDE